MSDINYIPVGKRLIGSFPDRMLGESPQNEQDNGYSRTYQAEDVNAIPFGCACKQGDAFNQAKIYAQAGSKFIGVAVVSKDATGVNPFDLIHIDRYSPGDLMGIKDRGFITVYCEEAVNPLSPVRIRHTPNGGTAGFDSANFSGALVGSNATGLANNSTVYTATVMVNGEPVSVSILGSAAQTFTALIAAINTALGGAAIAALSGSTIAITSAIIGLESNVSIQDSGLFTGLTGFVNVAAPVPGSIDTTPGFDTPAPDAPGNFRTTVIVGKTTRITSGARFNETTTGPGIVQIELGGLLSFANTDD